jgi:hypothetical protein
MGMSTFIIFALTDVELTVWRTSLLRALLFLLSHDSRALLRHWIEFVRLLVQKHASIKVTALA